TGACEHSGIPGQVCEADDICGATVDPCVISSVTTVASGALLDFGTRAVQVVPGGRLDFATGNSTLRCGALGVSTGAVTAFTADASNSLALSSVVVEASSVSFNGDMQGSGLRPARFSFLAAGDIDLSGQVELDGTADGSSGGNLFLTSTGASVTLASTVNASSGTNGAGGLVNVQAALDTEISGNIVATGHNDLGGDLLVSAGRDVFLHGDVNVNSSGATADEGSVLVDAGANIMFSGGGTGAAQLISSDGDGATSDYTAAGNIEVAGQTVLRMQPQPADAFGCELFMNAGGDLTMAGTVNASGGSTREGGDLSLRALAGTLTMSGSLNADGETGSVELVSIAGDLLLGGSVSAQALGAGQQSGSVIASAAGLADITGTVDVRGNDWLSTPELDIEACLVRVHGNAILRNSVLGGSFGGGVSRLAGRHSVTVETPAQVLADNTNGAVQIDWRPSGIAPLLTGSINPAATVTMDAALAACATSICGDGVLDTGEACDDGNFDDTDCCSLACIAANGTPCSDGDACTQTDTCQAGTCTGSNPVTCAALDQCHTVGSCNAATGVCSDPAVTNGAPCDDGDPATTGDQCVGGVCNGIDLCAAVTCTALDQCHT
ncbi:MAG: hypothetical protein ABGY28_09175, partial [bacterium]